jgi:predicted RNase H-like HicB family nuclease
MLKVYDRNPRQPRHSEREVQVGDDDQPIGDPRPTKSLTCTVALAIGTVREPSGTIGSMEFTAAITHDDSWYVARCLEVEVTSQGETVEEALANLKEALELYFEDEALPEDLEPPIIATLRLSA